MSQDFSKKISIVVSKELETWQICNVVGHISAYIGNKMTDAFDTGDFFETKNGMKIPRNSQFPIIVLTAKPGQMANLVEQARNAQVQNMYFIREMIETTDDTEISQILSKKTDSEIEYLGVGLFGDKKVVDGLTKKYKLIK